MKTAKKILLDTNFLLLPGQFKVDIFEGILQFIDFSAEFIVLDRIIDELKDIKSSKKSNLNGKMSASIALQLLEKKKVKVLKTSGNQNVDDLILEFGKICIIATQDKVLARRIRASGAQVISMRQKSHFVLK